MSGLHTGPSSLLLPLHQAHDSIFLADEEPGAPKSSQVPSSTLEWPLCCPRGPSQPSVRSLSPVALCTRRAHAAPLLALHVFTEYLLCAGPLLGLGLMMSDGEGPSSPCIQLQAPLLAQSCGRCMKGTPTGAASCERLSFLVRFTLSSLLCLLTAPSQSAVSCLWFSGCLHLSVFFAHCFLTLRDSWHLPPSPSKADSSGRKAEVPFVGSMGSYFPAPHGSGLPELSHHTHTTGHPTVLDCAPCCPRQARR